MFDKVLEFIRDPLQTLQQRLVKDVDLWKWDALGARG
jgi:hypothetical protein